MLNRCRTKTGRAEKVAVLHICSCGYAGPFPQSSRFCLPTGRLQAANAVPGATSASRSSCRQTAVEQWLRQLSMRRCPVSFFFVQSSWFCMLTRACRMRTLFLLRRWHHVLPVDRGQSSSGYVSFGYDGARFLFFCRQKSVRVVSASPSIAAARVVLL
jgi:hypothetical protein